MSMIWTDRIGRRLKPRDLHILMVVAEAGSMAKAAESLAVSPPVVSKTIASLEAALGVRLLDRMPAGVEVTAYGRALIQRGQAVFDELRRGVEDIAFLSDPGAGTLRIGCSEVAAAGIVAATVDRLARQYPRARFDIEQGSVATSLRILHERRADIVVSRVAETDPEVEFEPLLHEQLLVVCGTGSPWATRRGRITLPDLADAPWIQSRAELEVGGPTHEAFTALGLPVPLARVVSNSLNLRYALLETGNFLTMIPASALRISAPRARVRVLPVEIPRWPLPTVMATLKGRTLPPLVDLFRIHARAVASGLPEFGERRSGGHARLMMLSAT